MWPVKGRCCMSPAEDALLLLGLVRRHLRALEQNEFKRLEEAI